jgi:hypothetical protein
MFFPSFSFSLVQLIEFVQNANIYGAAMIVPGPGSLARNQHRVNGDQQDSRVDSAEQLGPAACNLDVQLCRYGPVTVLTEFLNNRLCHYGVFG